MNAIDDVNDGSALSDDVNDGVAVSALLLTVLLTVLLLTGGETELSSERAGAWPYLYIRFAKISEKRSRSARLASISNILIM